MNHSPSAESQRHGKVKLDRYRFISRSLLLPLEKPTAGEARCAWPGVGFVSVQPDYEFSRQARRNEWGGA